MAEAPENDLESCRRALQASEARFRNVIEKNADGVIVLSPEGVIRFVNPAAESLLQCSGRECIGTLLGIPLVPHERTEVDIPRRGGQPGAVAEMRVTETEWEGQPAYLASLRDVTERRRLEEELRRQAAELAEADRRKDEFLAMLAHELRNPLAPIRHALHLMRLDGAGGATAQRARDIAERQVAHMVRLVDDLLDVSRITRGKIQLRKEPIELADVIAHLVDSVAPLMESHGHQLHVSLAPEPLRLEADPARLEQVLANLLHNAAKYTRPGGRIWLTAARDRDEIVVRVRDNGIGIPPEMLSHVFELFAQADHSLDRSQGGLGIGLTLVKQLVEMHGGSVRAASGGQDQGSEFTVRLRALVGPAAPRAAVPPAAGEGPGKSGRPLRVLVVEDQRDTAEMLASLLALWGCDVRVAHDGLTATDAARAHRPEVVLLDLGLPGRNGYQVAEVLRKEPGLEQTLLVALTGYGLEEDRRRAREAGFDRHLVKPVDADALEMLLAEAGRRQ